MTKARIQDVLSFIVKASRSRTSPDFVNKYKWKYRLSDCSTDKDGLVQIMGFPSPRNHYPRVQTVSMS